MSAIVVTDLIKKYHGAETNAVDSVSFTVGEGEFFALLGPNGAGKTTTISILTTVLSKTSGVVKVAGFDISSQASEVRRNVGIIFQNPSLDLNLTAEENIRMHCVLYGLYPFRPTYRGMDEEYKKRVAELSGILGLQEREIFQPIKTFSGGMKRKLEIIRSLMHKPQVLFLDEPTVGLDPLSRKNLWEYMAEVRKRDRMTVFLTTHYLDEAENVDRVCIINRGRVVSLDTPQSIKESLLQHYVLIDSEERLKLRIELEQKGLSFQEGELPIKLMLNGRSVQEIIKIIDTPLSVLVVHQPSLEEAYLSVVEGS